ncbi:receptor-like protein 44 [Amaranthus tricolor]|uniref:receptor-like protein 44 n=1 Tax=Amaranthus tricolor TaxID=29722 RepID=UPI00258A1ADA|nr:receptor-like protein 44 [Amaranthus tricolor]
MKKHHHKTSISTIFIFFLLLHLQPTISDPNDEACLTQLYASFQDPNQSLKNWTQSNFANPCNGFDSHLQGATCNNGRIYRLSLSSLKLRGTISPSLSKCNNLQTLDLSSNQLSGEIPSELKDLSNLAVLNLSGNRLTGQIPPSLYLCAYLNVIDLHGNQLVGPIPQQLGLLVRLSTFDVSYNKLSGMIPPSIGNRSGNLPRFNATSFQGNKELYGYPLEPYKSKGLTVMAIVGIGLGSGLLSLIVSFTIVCIWLKISEQKMAAAEEGKISQLMPDY